MLELRLLLTEIEVLKHLPHALCGTAVWHSCVVNLSLYGKTDPECKQVGNFHFPLRMTGDCLTQ